MNGLLFCSILGYGIKFCLRATLVGYKGSYLLYLVIFDWLSLSFSFNIAGLWLCYAPLLKTFGTLSTLLTSSERMVLFGH